jgi:sugar O-acyltransferase (sialic acid O-acetyltransferase NeuD family)
MISKLVIIGAGGFGREVCAWAKMSSENGRTWDIKGFLDDKYGSLDASKVGAPIIDTLHEYEPEEGDLFVCAIGHPRARRRCHQIITQRGGAFATLVHPTAIIADRAVLGSGAIICPYAIVSVDAKIGEGTAVYYHSSVDHDAVVGPWGQISAHCDIAGGAVLGPGVFMGSHASILPGIHVGEGAIVGAGAIVTKDVLSGLTVVGVPAQPIS